MTQAAPPSARRLIEHLDEQLVSVRRLELIVAAQGRAIRGRAVREVVRMAGELQAEMHRRELLERQRVALVTELARGAGIDGAPTLTQLVGLFDPVEGEAVRVRAAELERMLQVVSADHELNRALMEQELAFLDHILGAVAGSGGYRQMGDGSRIRRSRPALVRPVFELEV